MDMFQKKIKPDQIDTVIGAGSHFRGIIEATGMVRVDGVLEGDIHTQGNIIIGERGMVKGNITGLHITLAGKLNGKVVSSGSIHILTTAEVTGDLDISKIMIEDGAKFEGNCKMRKSEKEANQVEKAS
jgi:cytoskeletal protein CcmA (bactofilin family)